MNNITNQDQASDERHATTKFIVTAMPVILGSLFAAALYGGFYWFIGGLFVGIWSTKGAVDIDWREREAERARVASLDKLAP